MKPWKSSRGNDSPETPGRLTSDFVAGFWEFRASTSHRRAARLLDGEGKQNQDSCRSGCCGLPPGAERIRAHEDCVRALRQAIRWGRATADNYYRLYWHYHHLQRFEEGSVACRKAIKHDPKHAHARYGLGLCLRQLCRYRDAAEAFEAYLNLEPDIRDAYEQLIQCYEWTGRTEDAARIRAAGLARFPDHEPLLREEYLALSKARRHDEALVLAERAAALSPNEFAPEAALGSVLCELGREGEALEHLRRAVELAPGRYDAIRPLLNLLERAGKKDVILEVLEEQATHPVLNPVDGLFLGKELYRRGSNESAERILRCVVPAMDFSAEAHLTLAKALKALGKLEEADQCLKSALAAVDSALCRLPELLSSLNTLDESTVDVAMKAAPAYESSTYATAVDVFVEAGDPARAREYLDRLTALDPKSARKIENRVRALDEQASGIDGIE